VAIVDRRLVGRPLTVFVSVELDQQNAALLTQFEQRMAAEEAAILAAGLAGMGVFRMTHFVVRAHLHSGALVPVLSDWRFDPLSVHVAFPPNRHVSAKLRVFVDWVAELMAEHAPMPALRRPTLQPAQTV
jgi:DNA-binding transcriptional LysR family regulator